MAAWFKPKRYGFGASPASWQGWVLTIGYVAALAGLGSWLAEGATQAESRMTTFIGLVTVLTIIFVGIAWRTTEGGWRWKNGDGDR